jgi:hypothetical protein
MSRTKRRGRGDQASAGRLGRPKVACLHLIVPKAECQNRSGCPYKMKALRKDVTHTQYSHQRLSSKHDPNTTRPSHWEMNLIEKTPECSLGTPHRTTRRITTPTRTTHYYLHNCMKTGCKHPPRARAGQTHTRYTGKKCLPHPHIATSYHQHF